MLNYILIDNIKKEEFEKKYQLPYGCYDTQIFGKSSDAIRLLMNMSNFDKKKYQVEKWDNGEFVEVMVKGEWLIV